MSPRIEELLRKLRRVERAVPPCVRKHWNYYGLRVDASGKWLSVAKREFKDNNKNTGAFEGDPDTILMRLDSFTRARREAGLEFAATIDPTFMGPARMGAVGGRRIASSEKCHAGDGCYADVNGRPVGTLGWFFLLDGVLVGLSNYHVLWADGAGTPGQTKIRRTASLHPKPETDPAIGELLAYSPALGDKRVFDCALARIDSESAICACFRPPNSANRVYPTALGCGELLSEGGAFYLIGAESDEVKMKFAGVGSRRMDYRSGNDRWLSQQLFFDKPNKHGDSGAIVVHERTNRVVGLNVGGDSRLTVACPIYRMPWRRVSPAHSPIGAFCSSRKG